MKHTAVNCWRTKSGVGPRKNIEVKNSSNGPVCYSRSRLQKNICGSKEFIQNGKKNSYTALERLASYLNCITRTSLQLRLMWRIYLNAKDIIPFLMIFP